MADGPPIDDDVPVYEPAYPKASNTCDHSNCTNSSEPNERLCEQCQNIMTMENPLIKCPYCKTERLGGRLDI